MNHVYRIIRLDFNHTHLDYFTEIDSIILTGLKYTAVNMSAQLLSNLRRNRRGPIERKLESVQFKPMKVQNHEDVLKDFLVNQFEHFIMESGMAPDDDVNRCNEFGKVPITLKDLPVRQ